VLTRYWATGLVPLKAAQDDDDDTRQCSNATLKGSFGYTGTGNIVSGPFAGPIAFVGRITFDGLGQATFAQTTSRNGTIIPAPPNPAYPPPTPTTVTETYIV